MRRAIFMLIVLEAAAFGLAEILHLGPPVFGRTEARISLEASVQATVGLLLAVSAWAIRAGKI